MFSIYCSIYYLQVPSIANSQSEKNLILSWFWLLSCSWTHLEQGLCTLLQQMPTGYYFGEPLGKGVREKGGRRLKRGQEKRHKASEMHHFSPCHKNKWQREPELINTLWEQGDFFSPSLWLWPLRVFFTFFFKHMEIIGNRRNFYSNLQRNTSGQIALKKKKKRKAGGSCVWI